MRCYLFLFLSICINAAHADVALDKLKSLTGNPEHLSGEFTQDKYINVLGASITSSGYFDYTKKGAIRWITESPVRNELVLNDGWLINAQDGEELIKIDLNNAGSVKIFHEILFSLLTAEWDGLVTLFQLQGFFQEREWKVVLHPRDAMVLQVLKKIELEGEQQVRKIAITEKNGDVTTIRFTYSKGL